MADQPLALLREEDLVTYDPRRLETARSSKRGLAAAQDAFDLMGGVPNLVNWAKENPTDYYTKIFTKTIDRQTSLELSGEITIKTAIPTTPLDGVYEDVTPQP
jgi:hypothetical protein